MRNRFPIRYKFLLVTTVLLVFSVVSYLFLASSIFRRDKIELVFDLNSSAVSSLSSEVSILFSGLADKMRLVAILSHDRGLLREGHSKALIHDILEADSNIAFAVASYGFQNLDYIYYVDKNYAETYGVTEEYFTKTLAEARPIPYAEIQTTGEAVWNATLKDGPPLIGFGKSVVPEIESAEGHSQVAPFAMIVFIRADKLIQTFSGSRLNEMFIVNKKGEPLVHSYPEPLWENRSFANHPLFQFAVSQSVRTGVLKFNLDDHEYLGAFSFDYGGRVYVLSQVDGRHAFAAVEHLVVRSLIFASIALTLAFLAAIFFSRSLTRPIQALAETMARVSRGDLGTRAKIKTRDEIAVLANSFNTMIADLHASRQQLEEINRDLEKKVRDRTKKLEEQNLAVKKAQEALLQTTRLATVGEVAGRAAHEVLNPLTSMVARLEKMRNRVQQGAVQEVALIKGIVKSWEDDHASGGFEKLIEGWKSPSALNPSISLWEEDIGNFKRVEENIGAELQNLVADVDFVLKESQRIHKIVQNMRALTRPREGVKIHSLGEIAQDAVKIMADLAEHHQIEIVSELASGDDRVSVDRDELIQCFTNLIRNSIQAIDERRRKGSEEKGRIRISSEIAKDKVYIEIEDNGCGISPENAAKLFEIQFTTKQMEEGTGLGLTITRRFIRDFGGDIVLKSSEVGKGCTFSIHLPLAADETKEERRVAS